MKRTFLSLILVLGCAGCADDKTRGVYTNGFGPDNKKEAYVVQDVSSIRPSLEAALPQLSRGAQPASLKSQRPAYSLRRTLVDVEKLSEAQIVAMCEYKNWFWYATEVAPTGDPNGAGPFLKGYAVQKGGFLVWKFSN